MKETKVYNLQNRSPELTAALCQVWECSVKATHLFLSEQEIKEIGEYVPAAIMGVPDLIIAENAKGDPAAFMGIDQNKLEMLFLSPEERGKGLGRQMLQVAVEDYGVSQLTVNEQNPQARGFYEKMGFRVYKREEKDEQGKPYPILYMKLQ